MRDSILIIDDKPDQRSNLYDILKDVYEITLKGNGFDAIESIILDAPDIDMIILDIDLKEMDGFEILSILSKGDYLSKIPLIVVTKEHSFANEQKALSFGCVDFISIPYHKDVLLYRIATQIEKSKKIRILEEQLEKKDVEVNKVRESIINVMANVIENRQVNSPKSIRRITKMAEMLLRKIRLAGTMDDEISNINIELASRAMALHDIGKITTPDSILFKPGKLDNEEFEITKEHTRKGALIVQTMKDLCEAEYLKYCNDICLYHHEKWNGDGYPFGLMGREIPFVARVMAIIDVYEALTSDRVYKTAITHEEAIDIIAGGIGKQFDPRIAEVFLHNHQLFRTKG